MNNNIKILLKVIIALLALTTIVSIIYGVGEKKTMSEFGSKNDEQILTTVDDAVLACRLAFNEVNATDEDLVNLNDYISNIENAKSPAQKAYIAESMITYTGDFLAVVQNKINNGMGEYTNTNFSAEQVKLMNIRADLRAASNLKNDNSNNSEQNTQSN